MPIDRGIVDQQLQALGEGSRWWDQRELRDLPGVLHEGEKIMALARGKLARVRVLRRSWLIVVTDQRLLCLRAGAAGWRQVEVHARSMERVAMRVGPFRARVLVLAGGTKYRLLIARPDAYRVHAALSALAGGGIAASGLGPTHVVRRMVDHVLALPAAAFAPAVPPPPALPAPDTSGLEQRLHLLEDHVQQLQQQVDFLEDLLRKSHVDIPTLERSSSR